MKQPDLTRRDLLKTTAQACAIAGLAPYSSLLQATTTTRRGATIRSINIINFLRAVEPRGPMDLFLPLQKQMEISLELDLPTTWLLQYDALVSGPFVEYLKAHMAKSHEVGIWFEMNEMHCKAAGVEWRGRPGYEWDHLPSVAFTIGYTPEERIKLADSFMSEFKKVWGKYPKSVASWNLDSITVAHLVEKYKVDAFAVCRDQIATDGFTIWGAPIAGYYPSKTNCWSPAVNRKEQINSPVFRMLGQDPTYYYQKGYPMPGGKRGSGPDTMEPVWPSGRSSTFIKNFLDMISVAPTLGFAYAQLGQENSFGWPSMADAYARQMKALVELRKTKTVHVETMGETGRRFKKAFRETPPQAQVMLTDSFGNTDRVERTIWYQSRFYRANLHMKGDLIYLRDLTVYSDKNPQPFLTQATRLEDVEQRMPPILDGFHWSKSPGSDEPGAGGYLVVNGERVRLTGEPVVREEGKRLIAELPVIGGKLIVTFDESSLTIRLPQDFNLAFEWDPSSSAFVGLSGQTANYRWQELDYSVKVSGTPVVTATGWEVASQSGSLSIQM